MCVVSSVAVWNFLRLSKKETEYAARLDAANEMFSKSFRAYPDAVLVTRLSDGMVIEVNDGFEEVAGYSRDEVLGKTTLGEGMWENPKDRERMVELLQRDGRVRGFEFLGRRGTGEVRLCRMSAEIFRGFDQPHIVTVIEDITELRRLQRETVQATDAERQRLARNLHDGVAQELAGANYLLRSLERWFPTEVGDCQEKLDTLQRTLGQAVDTVRTVAKGLSPIEIQHGGLEAACRRLALDITAMYDIEVHLHNCSAVSGSGRELETAIYHIVHEAVFNAAKHGDCDNITISFSAGDDFVSASVCDDGIGIKDDGTEGAGLGFGLMKQRAEALGGSIEVSQEPGVGTEVFCRLPSVPVSTAAAAQGVMELAN